MTTNSDWFFGCTPPTIHPAESTPITQSAEKHDAVARVSQEAQKTLLPVKSAPSRIRTALTVISGVLTLASVLVAILCIHHVLNGLSHHISIPSAILAKASIIQEIAALTAIGSGGVFAVSKMGIKPTGVWDTER